MAAKNSKKNAHNPLLDSLKKTFFIGLGASVLTADKVKAGVKDLVDDLVAKGHLNTTDAKKFADELKTKVASEKSSLENLVKSNLETTVKKTIQRLGLVTQDELEAAVKKAQQKVPKKAAPQKNSPKKPTSKKSSPKKTGSTKSTPAGKSKK